MAMNLALANMAMLANRLLTFGANEAESAILYRSMHPGDEATGAVEKTVRHGKNSLEPSKHYSVVSVLQGRVYHVCQYIARRE